MEPYCINETVPEIKMLLDASGISYKGLTRRDDLIAMLPNRDDYKRLSNAAQTMIDETLGAYADGEDSPNEWPVDDYRKCYGARFWQERGIAMEPVAAAEYERLTGHMCSQVGFVEHDSGYFGCSPDLLIDERSGVELKCLKGSSHHRMLLDYRRTGNFPSEFYWQVMATLACGFDEWTLFCWHPNMPPLMTSMKADHMTAKLALGLQMIGVEMDRQRQEMAALWDAMKGGEV